MWPTETTIKTAIDEDLKKKGEIMSKSDEQIRSNQLILFVTMVTFALFVVAEIIGAIASNSLSLLGDAAAMSIDVITVSLSLMP